MGSDLCGIALAAAYHWRGCSLLASYIILDVSPRRAELWTQLVSTGGRW